MYFPSPPFKKCGIKNRHHIIAKCNGGCDGPTINIDIMKHDAYHFFFGNRSLKQAREYLTRLEKAAYYKFNKHRKRQCA